MTRVRGAWLRAGAALVLLLAASWDAPPAAPGPDSAPGSTSGWRMTRLALQVHLSPDEGMISVRAEARLLPLDETPATIAFFLSQDLIVQAAEVNGAPVKWTLDDDRARAPFAPKARRIAVPAPVPADTAEVLLAVAYEGRIVGTAEALSRIGRNLTELNLYTAWFPILDGPQGFDYEMEVVVPAGILVTGNGRARETLEPRGEVRRPAERAASSGEGPTWRYRIRGSSAAGDVPLLASAAFSRIPVRHSGPCEVEVIATGLPEGVVEAVADEVAWACAFFASDGTESPETIDGGAAAAGETSGRSGLLLRLAIVPREEVGYARPPLVVVPAGWFTSGVLGVSDSPEEQAEWRRRLFHEIAHAFAPLAETQTYDDWINEGLAEHLALAAVAARRGPGAAARYLRAYTLALAERPPAPPVRPWEALPSGEGATDALAPDRAGAPPETPPEPPEIEPGPSGPGPREVPTPEELAATRIRIAAISSTRRSDPDAYLLYYRKGALIFRMLAKTLEPGTWIAVLDSLRERYPASSVARLTTRALIEELESETGMSFAWLRRDWIDGTALPEITADLRATRSPGGSEVRGEIFQRQPRKFRLRVPVVAHGKRSTASTLAQLAAERLIFRWSLPFKPSRILLDPERVIPRIDDAVREALRLRSIDSQVGRIVQDGLRAEREGRFEAALQAYERAAALDPSSPYPWYRRGRVLVALGRLDLALKEHRKASRIAERWARTQAGLEASCGPRAGMACEEPAVWIDRDPDLRSWNWVRIGQLLESAGRRRAALRAYGRALESPDYRWAHQEARRCIAAPCPERGPAGAGPR